MARKAPPDLLVRARAVELVVLDVDGVLTDGGLYYGPSGEAMKRFDVRDGHGIVLGRIVGLRTAILTARRGDIVVARAAELQIAPVVQGEKDKAQGLRRLLSEAGVEAERAAYMGDDVNDLAPLSMVGLAACPSDAAVEVKRSCHFIAQEAGGRGAVRELYEFLICSQGKWKAALDAMRTAPLPARENRRARRSRR